MVNLKVVAVGHFCNHWPFLRIYHNNQILFDREITGQENIILQLDAREANELKFEHYGKSFGENGTWDCQPDAELDCFLEIKDIKFDQVSIGEKIRSNLEFQTIPTSNQQLDSDFLNEYSLIKNCNGLMNFNGTISLAYETPVYNWLTIKKFKVPVSKEEAYFSNYSIRWNYEEDLKILKELKHMMGFDENCNHCRTES